VSAAAHQCPKCGLSTGEAAEYWGVSVKTLDRHGPSPTKIDRRMLDRWLNELAALVPAGFRGSNTLVRAIRVSQNRGRAAQFFRSSPDGREADFQMLRFEPDGAPNKRR
jgi:hypothetical protein